MPFILLGFLITLRGFHALREYLKDKRKSRHDFMFPKGDAYSFLHKSIEVFIY